MDQDETKTSAEMTDSKALHPSGLTWERWNQPFKMPHERKMIQEWMRRKTGQDLFDERTPF